MPKQMSEEEVEAQIKLVTHRLLQNEAKEKGGIDPVLSPARKVKIREDMLLLEDLTLMQEKMRLPLLSTPPS